MKNLIKIYNFYLEFEKINEKQKRNTYNYFIQYFKYKLKIFIIFLYKISLTHLIIIKYFLLIFNEFNLVDLFLPFFYFQIGKIIFLIWYHIHMKLILNCRIFYIFLYSSQ